MLTRMREPLRATAADAFALGEFLRSVDLTTAGLDDSHLQLWIDLDPDGRIVGTTGFEFTDGDALIRSVAVAAHLRGSGRGTELARFALDQVIALGAQRAWLMSRRSGAFWQTLGFVSADIHQLAAALLTTTQVREFAATGQLDYETAWLRQF
jgi:N-acetylglutamate synthase-like GNAT family acetyltransferase